MTQNFRTIWKTFVICRECREVSATRRTCAHYPFSSFDVIGRIANHPWNDDLARETLTSLNSGCDDNDDVNIHPSEKRALLSLNETQSRSQAQRKCFRPKKCGATIRFLDETSQKHPRIRRGFFYFCPHGAAGGTTEMWVSRTISINQPHVARVRWTNSPTAKEKSIQEKRNGKFWFYPLTFLLRRRRKGL